MNSRQRRHNRVFQYKVTLTQYSSELYIDFYNRAIMAEGWLRNRTKNEKKKTWKYTGNYLNKSFVFIDSLIATEFSLKWQ